MGSDSRIALGLLGVAIAVFGVSISILGVPILQASPNNFIGYIVLGVITSLVGVIIAAVAVMRSSSS